MENKKKNSMLIKGAELKINAKQMVMKNTMLDHFLIDSGRLCNRFFTFFFELLKSPNLKDFSTVWFDLVVSWMSVISA